MIDQYPSANGVLTSLIWRKTAAGGETSLSGYDNASQALSYTPGQEQVYLNGILLVRGLDYTATNGTSITALAALAADDFVQINCYNNFSVASVPSTSITGTIANNQLANSAITINGNAVSLGGSVSLPGDIESVTAGTGLSGGGNSGAVTLTNTVATTFDAAGDLVYGTGADTFTKLSLGTAGQILKVNSGATAPEWAAPAATTPTFVGCVLTKSVGQSIPNTTVTDITWDVESIDTNTFHDNVTNNNRITIPSGYAGYYLITTGLTWGNVSGGAFRTAYVLKNTTQLGIGNAYNLRGTANVTFIAQMAVGDYFQIRYYQDSGGTNTLEGNNFTPGASYCAVTYLGV